MKSEASPFATDSIGSNSPEDEEGEWIVIHEERRTIPDQTLNLMLIMMGLMFLAASIMMVVFYGPIGP